MAQTMASFLPSAGEEVGRGLLDRVSQTYGVLCLSKTRESILMWGHYCDKHRGLVIGFDASHTVFGEKRLAPVRYARERVIFDASWLERDPRLHPFEEKIIFSKNSDWSYEQELRQMFKLNALKQGRPRDGTPGYFLPLPPESIVSVTVGARCSDDLLVEVQSVLRNPRLAHVGVERAALDENEFALVFVPVAYS